MSSPDRKEPCALSEHGVSFPGPNLLFLQAPTFISPLFKGGAENTRGVPPKPRIIFCRAGPLSYRLPPPGKGSGNPSVSVHQLALL